MQKRRKQILVFTSLLFIYMITRKNHECDIINDIAKVYVESTLQEAIKYETGIACSIPKLDPFKKEIIALDKRYIQINCSSKDWVKCYMHECRPTHEVLMTTRYIRCIYRDIIHKGDDSNSILGPPALVLDNKPYILYRSDRVKIDCTGQRENSVISSKWIGYGIGFRTSVPQPLELPGWKHAINILIVAFDSTSKNGFIREMPKSYVYLKKIIGATFLNTFNILGDGAPATLFPMLSGKDEFEFAGVRRGGKVKEYINSYDFIFYLLKQYGYRSAFFENSPHIGSFQYHYNGFSRQPSDHYLRSLLLEDQKTGNGDCVGDTPLHKLMMNLTKQFLKLPGKKICFTSIAATRHYEFRRIHTIDDDTLIFLQQLYEQNVFKNTMLFFMGSHGPKYAEIRQTLQGKYEERLPLMAVVLPTALTNARPLVHTILKDNKDVLTTPHDVYATILDALDLKKHWNTYITPGADIYRGLSLLRPIPRDRMCSEAGILPHWCTCTSWIDVNRTEGVFYAAAEAFVQFVNQLTKPFRSLCALRTLKSISWMMRRKEKKLNLYLSMEERGTGKFYGDRYEKKNSGKKERLQLKVTLGPSEGTFEASFAYIPENNKFVFNTREISRTNMYHKEAECISPTHPELEMFCNCNT